MKSPLDIIKEYYSCVCIDAYKNRGLADPNCVLCNEGDEMAKMMEEYGKEVAIAFATDYGRRVYAQHTSSDDPFKDGDDRMDVRYKFFCEQNTKP